MHAKEARQSERQREKKEGREEKEDKEKRRARDDLRFQTRTAAFARATREKERAGKTLRFFPKIAGQREEEERNARKKKNFESGALTSTSTRPPLCELDGLTR